MADRFEKVRRAGHDSSSARASARLPSPLQGRRQPNLQEVTDWCWDGDMTINLSQMVCERLVKWQGPEWRTFFIDYDMTNFLLRLERKCSVAGCISPDDRLLIRWLFQGKTIDTNFSLRPSSAKTPKLCSRRRSVPSISKASLRISSLKSEPPSTSVLIQRRPRRGPTSIEAGLSQPRWM